MTELEFEILSPYLAFKTNDQSIESLNKQGQKYLSVLILSYFNPTNQTETSCTLKFFDAPQSSCNRLAIMEHTG